MADYRRLDVWNAGRRVAVLAYRTTTSLPAEEKFGLTSQIRRAAVSIPANVAEGAGRGSDRDFARFVRIAIGSANELDTLLTLSVDLGLLEESPLEEISIELRDLAVRLRNLATRLDASSAREPLALYDQPDPEP